MAEINIALLGGDKREIEVAAALLPRYRLHCFGLPERDLPQSPRLTLARTLAEALNGADAVILPMAGVNENGLLYAPLCGEIGVRRDDWALLRRGTPVLVGVASDYLRKLCAELSLPLFEVAEHDLVAIPNAVPTAEGAIYLLLRDTDITVNGMRVLVVGFGRVGEALAIRLRALGAEVAVVNRGESRLAKAEALGFSVLNWADWQTLPQNFDVVINTVPARVLGRTVLSQLPKGAMVLDLASGVGGTDFAAAEEIGVRAVHALSLPGKVAPVSAGRILGQVYPRYLSAVCGLPPYTDNEENERR